MKRLFLSTLFLLFSCNVYANAYVSQQDGNWSRASNNADSPWFDGGVQSGWASFPQAADTVTIAVGDTVTIDGNIAVGNNAANDTTYNIDILGNLVWPQSPAGNWTFSPSSTILLNGTGKFYIGCSPGSPTDRLNCNNTAIIEFQTAGAVTYDLRIDGASAQLIARGCEGYPANAAGTETRARITACAPDCNAGPNRTFTLDTVVDWTTTVSGNPATVSGNADVVIGSGGNLTPPGGWNAEVAEINLYPAANQIRIATLANNHQIGDILANPTRNILFTVSSPATHGSVFADPPSGQTLKPFMLSWVRFDEMGSGTTVTTTAIGINLNATTDNWGTIEYTWLTNCGQGAGNAHCMYILEGDWDSFDWNGVHDPGTTGSGIYVVANRFNKTITGFTAIDIGGAGIPQGYAFSSGSGTPNKIMDQMWVSCAGRGHAGSTQGINNSIFHHIYNSGINTPIGYTYARHIPIIYADNEFRNIRLNGLQSQAHTAWLLRNDFDNCDGSCVFLDVGIQTMVDHYSIDNTYDNCNADDTAGDVEGGVQLNMFSGTYYSTNDSFGATDANHRNNISIRHPNISAGSENWRVIVNDAVYVNPANPTWAYPFRFYQNNVWTYKVAREAHTFATMHNQNQVEGVMFGFGPGGMIIERVTGAGPTGGWPEDNLNLKIIPFAADRYCRVPLGKIHVDSGDTLTVDLQIQKNQAIAAGRRPRLVLKGSGFDLIADYDEMTNVNNAWDAVQVVGVATATGLVHIYVEVLNDLEPAPGVDYVGIEPVDPPTIIVYVDGISYTKS